MKAPPGSFCVLVHISILCSEPVPGATQVITKTDILESRVALEGKRVRTFGLNIEGAWNPDYVSAEKAPKMVSKWCLSFSGVMEILQVLGFQNRNSRCSPASHKLRDLGKPHNHLRKKATSSLSSPAK